MSTEHWFHSRLHEIAESDCRELLEAHAVGRIVFNDHVGPVALPVNYTLDRGDILVATRAYGSVARSVPGKVVAFEIDDVDDFTASGWSVVVRGPARLVGLNDLPDESNRPYPWAEGNRNLLLRIRPDTISGRRLFPA